MAKKVVSLGADKGEVALEVNFNLFLLDEDEREFITDLVDRFRRFEEERERPASGRARE